jgi:hypothetical protein
MLAQVSGDNTWAENSYGVSVFWSDNPVEGFERIPGEYRDHSTYSH